MIAGVGVAGTASDTSNSAITAGLPSPRWFQYQAEVSRLIDTTCAAPTRIQGMGNRITQAEIDAMNTGVGLVFTDLENALVAEVFGEKLPLIGDGFQIARINNVDAFVHLTNLRNSIVTALNGFTGSDDYDPAAVATAILGQLGGFTTPTVVASTPDDGARIEFATQRAYPNRTVPVGADLGFPALDIERKTAANVQTTINTRLDFAIGVDADGFYFETEDAVFHFHTATTAAASLNTTVRLAKLEHQVTHNNATPTTITANFDILLKEPSGDGKLRISELASQPDILDATLTGNTRTALKLTSSTPNTALFPRVGTDLTLLWDFENAVVDPDDDNSTFGSQPVLTLNNNRVLLDSFLNHFASGVLSKIRDVTQPVQPVIDVLGTPIPLLSDLGSSDVSLMDIFDLPQATQDAVNSLSRINTLANLAEGLSAAGMTMDLGDWSFAPDDPRVDAPDDLTGFATRPPSSSRPAPLNTFLTEADKITGLDFPILTNGKPVVDMLLGRNASLFNYQSGEIKIEEGFSQYFPVLGPVGITMGGEIGFRAQFGFGYDTQGMFDYFAGGSNDTSLLANGFYAMSLDGQGNPLTGVELYGAFTAGVEINLFIASAGVEGRIGATIGIHLDDQLGDEFGHIRADDFAANSIDDWFYASGRFWAGLRAYLEIGWPPFGIEFEFESPEVTLLSFDSRPNQTPILAMRNPGNLDHLDLNVGDRAPLRIHGDNVDTSENYSIKTALMQNDLGPPRETLVVEAFGAVNTFHPLPTKIIGHANLRGDTLEIEHTLDIPVHFTGGADRDILRGGAGDDVLEGGDGPDHLVGNGGDDILRGGEGNDMLDGGDGSDIFDGGPGIDTAAWTGATIPMTMDLRTMTFGGAAIGDTLISIERYRGTRFNDIMDGSEGDDLLIHGDDGDDIIRGHGGSDLLNGGRGDDIIEGGEGDDHIIGGPGADTLDGGPGTDTLSFLDAAFPVTASLLTGQGTRGEASGDTYANFEILVGSGLPMDLSALGINPTPEETGDILHGDHGPNIIYGMDGTDEIRGHGGDDILYGNHPDSPLSKKPGFDADRIFGGDGNDTLYGHGDDDLLDGEAGTDTLYGGPGNDHLIDLDTASPDYLDGEEGYDRLTADYSDKTQAITFITGHENSHVFPDGDQYHNMETLGTFRTGSGDDVIRLAAGPEPERFNKFIDAGPGNDLVVADSRHSYGLAGRSSDSLHGGDGIDTISFENSIAGVTVNLSNNTVAGAATGLTISGFENIIGSHSKDLLIGDAGDNFFYPLGHRGPGDGWIDEIQGGNGIDTLVVDFTNDEQAHVHGVIMGANSGSWAMINLKGGMDWQRYWYSSIEQFHIHGSNGPDTFYGELVSSVNDIFYGHGGNDHIEGRGGDDYIDGGEGNDYLDGGNGSDTILGGPGNDTITFALGPGWDYGYGDDYANGGPGDDFISNLYSVNSETGYATPGNRIRLDGGPGFDTVSADAARALGPVVTEEPKPIHIDLPNGGYITNFERVRDLVTGGFDDVILLDGRYDNRINTGGGNDIVNPGLGIDYVILGQAPGNTDSDLLILDYSKGDDPDLTGCIPDPNTSVMASRRRISDNTVVDSLTVFSMERLHFVGSSKNDTITGGPKGNILLGGAGNDTLDTGSQNSGVRNWLDGGPGADIMRGTIGDDTYIVDNPGDQVIETITWIYSGNDTVRASINYTLPVAIENLVLTGTATHGTGNELNNVLTGNSQNNLLNGGMGNDTLNGGGGAGEIDTLTGGGGADTFVLGEGGTRYYDDGNPSTPGHNGYALITDFTPSQNDRLRLSGAAGQYLLGVSPFNPDDDDALYHDSNGNTVLDPSDELIAILQSTETLTAANTLGNSIYQNGVDPALAGIGSAPLAGFTDHGTGPALTASFEMFESIPANLRLEVQASDDLGLGDPWMTLATKSGSGAWSGPGTVTVSPAADGRVRISVRDVWQAERPSRRFLRLRLLPH